MPEIFQHDFILRALAIGYLAAILSGIIGNFLVASRNAVVSEMISHVALAGVGLGVLLQVSPNLMALLFSFGVSFLLYLLTRKKKGLNEAVAMSLLNGGIALALLFIHLGKDNPISIQSYLFGSILTTTQEELTWFAVLGGAMILTFAAYWNRFLALIFSQDVFYQRYRSAKYYEILFFLMLGVLIAFSLKIIGSLLVGALLVIPVMTAQSFARSFSQSVLLTIGFNLIGITLGIFSSYYFDIPTSSGIVLSLVIIFITTRLLKRH